MNIDEMNDIETSSESKLADMFSEFLLLELIQNKKAEIYENVVFEGKKRYYIEDLTKRDYNLENTTPYQLSVYDRIIVATSWGKLLTDTVNYLCELNDYDNETLLHFRTEWTKAEIFVTVSKTNHRQLANGLYLNCNHTALHSCWLLQDLLKLFSVELSGVTLLIHRPCSAEPENIKQYIEKRFKKGMIEYLITEHQASEQTANTIVTAIAKYLNPMLATISRSYNNFFLFDDEATLYNYVKKVRDKVNGAPNLKFEGKKLLNVSLDYLVKYFKCSTY